MSASSTEQQQHQSSSSSKYYTDVLSIPPVPNNQTLYCPVSKTKTQYGTPLQVTYTNDPAVAWKWISDQIPSAAAIPPEHVVVKKSSSAAEGGNPGPVDVVVVVVGFDMESSPKLPWRENQSYVGPATVQLSVLDATLVVQIGQDDCDGPFDDRSITFLKQLMSNPYIIFVGVGIDEDFMELHRWKRQIFQEDLNQQQQQQQQQQESTASPSLPLRIDLGGIGGPDYKCKTGLKRLTQSILGVELRKSKRLARSPWGNFPLTNPQIDYAARDAWAAVAVWHRLQSLDPATFSSQALLDSIVEQEETRRGDGLPVTIPDLSDRAEKRRDAKQRWQELLQAEEATWTDPQRANASALYRRMQALAPPPCIRFDIESSLNIKV
jgi:hypothetical protein